MKSPFSILSIFLVALLTSSPLFAAIQLTATVSDNQVVKGDVFILTITINDKDDDYQLNTDPLKQAFTVYRPSQSRSSNLINGHFTQQTQWKVRLQAKQSGSFIIPSLKIGDFNTDPINIKVIEPSQIKQDDTSQNRTVFIENSINKEEVYIGQSFIFTTKLYFSKNSNELDLIAPSFEGAEASVFGEDNNSQTVINGMRYNIITRQYKLSATQAGQFEIDSPLLTGTLLKEVALNQWQNTMVADPINVRGERLHINVKAIPDNYQGDWLVSDDLHLIENNDLTAKSYKVGEPITRSITLQVASIDKEKLPNINLNYPKSLRFYPDKDQLKEGQANGLTYAIRIISHAIIAEHEGTLTLPEIKLNWFNSRTGKAETAILPAQALTILATEQQPLNTPVINQAMERPTDTMVIVDHQALIYWQIAVLLLIIIMLFMVFYHLSFRRSHERKIAVKIEVTPLNYHYLMLQDSFKKHDAPKCYTMLLKYAQQQYPTIKSLSELVVKCALDEEKRQLLKHEIQWLQICCSDKSQLWNANKLAELIKANELEKAPKNNQDPLNLNP